MATEPLIGLAALRALGEAAKAKIDAETALTKRAERLIDKAKEKVKAARGSEARDSAREELRQASADAARMLEEILWKPEALVFRTVHWTCSCASDMEQEEPLGLFTRYIHVKGQGTRFVAVKAGDTWPDLPRERETLERNVDLCPYCIEDKGFFYPGEAPEPEPEPLNVWQVAGEVDLHLLTLGGGWLPDEGELLRDDMISAYALTPSEESDDDEEGEEELDIDPTEEHF